MANKKISVLSAAASLAGTEVLPIVQAGATVKTTTQDIANLFGGGAVSLSDLVAAGGANNINNGNNRQIWNWDSLGNNQGLWLSSTSTAAAGNNQLLFNLTLSGANATSTQITIGASFANTHTGTASTNIAAQFSASGGTNNYAALFTAGLVGFGTTTPTAKAHFAASSSSASTAPIKLTSGVVMTSAEAGAFEYTTPQLFFTNGGAQRQEIPQIQQSRVSTQFDKTSSTTLSSITGLSATLVAAKIYRFELNLYTTADTASGVKIAFGGGAATATTFIAESYITAADSASPVAKRLSALSTTHGVTASDTGHIHVLGTIVVNGAGTFIPQFSQNVSGVVASSVLVGSTMMLTEMA